jgi:FtsP/CotA-like multicopper oxidase with cupredoxin domain
MSTTLATAGIIILLVALAGCAPTPPKGSSLPDATPSQAVVLEDNATFQLDARPVAKDIAGAQLEMLAYNGQIPGPLLKVRQGSSVWINFTNHLDMPTTVHWHGIRLENRYDGVPDVTQPPVMPGESFLYRLDFPDEGMYWYHPHMREELQQELGLYGAIMVEPADEAYYGAVDREEVLILDDILLQDGEVWPFREVTDFAMMGRYGNAMLVNGESGYSLRLRRGETVRFFVLDAANVRPFRLAIEGVRLKVIGGDGGRQEKEELADAVVLSPSERAIIEATFEEEGTFRVIDANPEKRRVLGEIVVDDAPAAPETRAGETAGEQDIAAEMEPYRRYLDAPVDIEYTLSVDMPGADMGMMGMMEMGHGDGIEWEDGMFDMNRMSTSEMLTWRITDAATGKSNMDAMRAVAVGEPVKIRLVNTLHAMHPMQHPIHIHGAQFLVLSRDGERNENLLWKDTVLVPAGHEVEILAIFPKPGEWMVHCHIAEHLSSGMMTAIVAE